MDGVELAAGGADAAADALVLIHGGGPAAEAAGGLQFHLLLGEGDAVIPEGLGFALVVQLLLPGGHVQLFGGNSGIALVKLFKVSGIAGQSQAVARVDKAVDGNGALTTAGDGVNGVLGTGDRVAAAENVRLGGLEGDLSHLHDAAILI